MIRTAIVAAALALSVSSAWAQDALRDMARAQERQARALEQMERLERDRARDADRARRNAERDSRSSCCKVR